MTTTYIIYIQRKAGSYDQNKDEPEFAKILSNNVTPKTTEGSLW